VLADHFVQRSIVFSVVNNASLVFLLSSLDYS
jgi:hypothetical protein